MVLVRGQAEDLRVYQVLEPRSTLGHLSIGISDLGYVCSIRMVGAWSHGDQAVSVNDSRRFGPSPSVITSAIKSAVQRATGGGK